MRPSWFLLIVLGNLLSLHVGSPFVAGGAATNRLLEENGDGLLLEDSSGDVALE